MLEKLDRPMLKVADEEVQKLLERVHNLLLAHQYDCLLDKVLKRARSLWPEIERLYQALDTGETGWDARPKALEIIDDLLDLEEMHRREALHLGYLVGRAQTIGEDGDPSIQEYALQVIHQLGLTGLMEYNLSYSCLLTEKGIAALEGTK